MDAREKQRAGLRPRQKRVFCAGLRPGNLHRPLEEVAESLGVGHDALDRWLADPEVCEAYRVLALEAARRAHPEVLKALIAQAAGGSVQHMRLFFELVGPEGDRPFPSAADAEFDSEVLREYMRRLDGSEES